MFFVAVSRALSKHWLLCSELKRYPVQFRWSTVYICIQCCSFCERLRSHKHVKCISFLRKHLPSSILKTLRIFIHMTWKMQRRSEFLSLMTILVSCISLVSFQADDTGGLLHVSGGDDSLRCYTQPWAPLGGLHHRWSSRVILSFIHCFVFFVLFFLAG